MHLSERNQLLEERSVKRSNDDDLRLWRYIQNEPVPSLQIILHFLNLRVNIRISLDRFRLNVNDSLVSVLFARVYVHQLHHTY